jgi:polyhydroxyalkanoate synthesis regulator protein
MTPGASGEQGKTAANDSAPAARDEEIRELKDQLAAMREQIAQLARKD